MHLGKYIERQAHELHIVIINVFLSLVIFNNLFVVSEPKKDSDELKKGELFELY